MLLVPTELGMSPIEGVGVFLLAPVKKGELIWRFDPRIDRVYTEAEVSNMPELLEKTIRTYAAWDSAKELWMYCGDNARHFNHSEQPSAVTITRGPFDDNVAVQDLDAGVELTNDYAMICDRFSTVRQFYR